MATPTAAEIIQRLSNLNPILWKFVSGLCYVMGIFFALRSIYIFKEYGEMRVMMSAQTDVRKPVMYLFIALVFLYAPFVAAQFVHTFFGGSAVTPFSYLSGHISGQDFKKLVSLIGSFVQFVGFIAFVRGWLILSRSVQQSAQPGTMAKGFTHIVAGVLALNIYGTIAAVQKTFGG